ncbi:MAG: peptidoglycan-binding protein [Candidatus Nanopelagicales bacterium]
MVMTYGVGRRVSASVAFALILGAVVPAVSDAAPPPLADADSREGSGSVSAMALISWYPAPSLLKLRKEIDARWPGRSRASDGVIGDLRHSGTRNSHNPVGTATGPRVGTRGAVHAMDITASGINVQSVLNAVIGDSRVWYVIHGGRIWSRTYGWTARRQAGDPHTTHIHINLREDSQTASRTAENDTRSWFGSAPTQPAISAPGAGVSLSSDQVRIIQKALIKKGFTIPAGATGMYGAQTAAAMAAFQRSQGWRGSQADGGVGPESLRRLGVPLTAAGKPAVTKATPKPAASTGPVTSTPAGTWNKRDAGLVANLQKALIKRGYSIPAGPTGTFGSQTKAAVKKFQKAQGWSGPQADGIPGAATLKRLGVSGSGSSASSPAAAPKATTPSKSTSWNPKNGTLVYKLQQALIKRGYAIPAGPTGYFGPRTKAAVKKFQKAQGWSGSDADGIPGKGTLRRLGL